MNIFTASILLLNLVMSFSYADEIVVFSGGGTPSGNHFSQYLQTKTLFNYLSEITQKEQTKLFFGAGNRPDEPAIMADVHKLDRSTGKAIEVLIKGDIENNNRASKENILNYLSENKLKYLDPAENFFIFVSDHGMPNRSSEGVRDKTYSNNCIDSWGFDADLKEERFNLLKFPYRCLSKDELKNKLEKISAKNIIFSMSQCYSGGFHQMSVTHQGGYPTANTKICGFTAITKDTTASGCTPDVDGPNYQGYERYFTENLTGVDVVSGERLRPPRVSIQDAHRAATVQDLTKDIPISTSDSYLMDWYNLVSSPNFKNRASDHDIESIQTLMNTRSVPGKIYSNDKNYMSKNSFFYRVTRELSRAYPELQKEFYGPLAELKKLFDQAEADDQSSSDAAFTIYDALSKNEDVLTQYWSKYVKEGKSSLPEYSKILEGIISDYDAQDGYGTGDEALIYILSIKTINNPQKAELISLYKADRITKALEWALNSKDLRLVSLARRIQALNEQAKNASELNDQLNKRAGLIRRILTYRQILGAWNAIMSMNDTKAIEELNGLLACEATQLKIN